MNTLINLFSEKCKVTQIKQMTLKRHIQMILFSCIKLINHKNQDLSFNHWTHKLIIENSFVFISTHSKVFKYHCFYSIFKKALFQQKAFFFFLHYNNAELVSFIW